MTSGNGSGFYWVRVAVPVEVLDEIYGGNTQGQVYGPASRQPRMYGQVQQFPAAAATGVRSGQTGYAGSSGQAAQVNGPQNAWGAYAEPTQSWEAREVRHMTPHEIERYVNLALDQHPRTANADINATVAGGTITLSGRTRTKEAKRDAERIAWNTPDVQDVENNIQVLGRTSPK